MQRVALRVDICQRLRQDEHRPVRPLAADDHAAPRDAQRVPQHDAPHRQDQRRPPGGRGRRSAQGPWVSSQVSPSAFTPWERASATAFATRPGGGRSPMWYPAREKSGIRGLSRSEQGAGEEADGARSLEHAESAATTNAKIPLRLTGSD